jgi:hypothetical protein
MTAPVTSGQIRALQTARKAAGFDDDTWHDRLRERYSVTSTKLLTVPQARAELDSLKGSAPARRADGRLKLSGPYAGKLQALWIGAWNLGIVDNRDDAALVAFVKRQTGIDHVRWVQDAEDAAKAIEALKGWMAREGGVDWTESKNDPALLKLPQVKIVNAQYAIIAKSRAVPPLRDMLATIIPGAYRDLPPGVGPDLTSSDLMKIMNEFGAQIRDLKGA